MRIFVALDLPDEVTDPLDRLQSKLMAGRAVPQDDLHLTILFNEDASEDTLEELHMRLEMIYPPLPTLRITGADIFGTDPPRSLHMNVDGGAPLRELQKKIAGAARMAGLTMQHRRFVPHITLARFSRQLDSIRLARIGRFLQAHGDWTLPPFVPPSLSMYQSTLGADDPRYDLLARYGTDPVLGGG